MRDAADIIHLYADVIRLWGHRIDTADIADRLDVPEAVVAGWVANFRDVTREKARA